MLYDNDGNGTFEEASYSQIRDFDKDTIADWKEVTDFFKSKGWEWGGAWKRFPDAPDFQMTFGHTAKTLKALIDKGHFIENKGIKYPLL